MVPSPKLPMKVMLSESTSTLSRIRPHAELIQQIPSKLRASRTKSALTPSTRRKSSPILTQNVLVKITALLISIILRAKINTSRTTSHHQKITPIAINLLLNSSCSTPVSNQVQIKSKSMTRLASRLLSSCLLPSYSSWSSTILSRL
jgi:hypothetical protein